MKIAAKRLTHTDVLLFEPYFERHANSRQKAINLDVNPFTKLLYPALDRSNPSRPLTMDVDLVVIGPASQRPYHLTRKILLQQKNWRLNGIIIPNPEDEPDRFDRMEPGDLAILMFDGDPIPTSVELVLLSQTATEDAAMFGRLTREIGNRSTVPLSRGQFEEIVNESPNGHAARVLLEDPEVEATLEEAALGYTHGLEGFVEQRRRAGATPVVTASRLKAARERAEETGLMGEVLVNSLLEDERQAGRFREVRWASDENAIESFDFEAITVAGELLRIDVKTTTGVFERPFHVSAAELRTASSSEASYLIYRVYSPNEDGSAFLRRSEPIDRLAQAILEATASLPLGTAIDGVTISPSALTWGPAELVQPT